MADRDTKQHFDQGARDYYRLNYEKPKNRHELTLALRREVCLELVPPSRGRVLDLGCGPGAMTVPLVSMGYRVVAADLSIEMALEAARHVLSLDVAPSSVAANAMSLPFRDNAFSIVVTTGVLEYVPDLRQALREIHRVLEVDGIVIATMSLPRKFERLAARAYAAVRRGGPGVRQYIYNRPDFDQAIEESGFAIDVTRCGSFAPFPLDALWPPSVAWIDRVLGRALNRSSLARDHAKTYIVRASRR